MKLKVFVATYRPLLKLPQQCLRLHGDFAKAWQAEDQSTENRYCTASGLDGILLGI
jgi:hypothetical protein